MSLLSKKTFKSAALGIGALAMVSAANVGITSQAHAEDARPVATAAASYSELGLPAAQAPTEQRPYHYLRFDEQTKTQYPDARVHDIQPFMASDKLLVINFIDEGSQYSQMQTQVLNHTLKALSAHSQDKELMLLDVVVFDDQDNQIYLADYEVQFQNNELGPNGQALPTAEIPYLVAWGEPLSEGGNGRLFDAALMNGVKNDADLNENAEAIAGKLFITVEGYNQKKVAAASYAQLGLPVAEAPTAERPYHYMRFDEQTKMTHPGADPITAMTLNGEKLVVVNFIDEKNPGSSEMQSQVLNQTLTALAPRSTSKELMLMDIVVRDAQGNDVNWSYFSTFYDDNKLGPNSTKREDALLPYGLAYGEPLNQNGNPTLFDFSLMNGAKNDADLRENAKRIYGKLYVTVEGYNQKKVAAEKQPALE